MFWLPTYLVKARGFTENELKWTAIPWVAGMFGNALGGMISDGAVLRLGRGAGRRVIGIAGMLVVAAVLLVMTLVESKQVTLAALGVCGITWGVIQANVFAACIDIGGVHTGTVAGTMNTAGQLGGALSALVFGYLAKLAGSYETPVMVMAAASALGATGWLWIDASRPLVRHYGGVASGLIATE